MLLAAIQCEACSYLETHGCYVPHTLGNVGVGGG